MKKYLTYLKNNSPYQNLFLVIATIACIGAAIESNIQAVVAWFCGFVIYLMFCGERDQNKWLRERLNEARMEQYPELKNELEQINSIKK